MNYKLARPQDGAWVRFARTPGCNGLIGSSTGLIGERGIGFVRFGFGAYTFDTVRPIQEGLPSHPRHPDVPSYIEHLSRALESTCLQRYNYSLRSEAS